MEGCINNYFQEIKEQCGKLTAPLDLEDVFSDWTHLQLQSLGEWLGLPTEDLTTTVSKAVKSIVFKLLSSNITAACEHIKNHLSRLTTEAAVGWLKDEVEFKGLSNLGQIAETLKLDNSGNSEQMIKAIADHCTRIDR